MPDSNRPRLKVSRAGIVLIKSFESFRPRAVQRADGRWVIGYGHTASAREGLTVGEQDAELLLQYDLMPVAKALNEDVEAVLNQHQFDALASFAVSVGVERFLASDVRSRLNAGHAGEAADALIGWPESLSPETALRRRAAERALFVADPASPVLLSDLLAAPLPPPPVAAPEPGLSRAAAVASLLGEPHEDEPEAVDSAAVAPEPVADEPVAAPTAEPAPGSAPVAVEPEPAAVAEAPRPLPLPSVWVPQSGWDASLPPAAVAHAQRYSPYSNIIVGPLPGFPTTAQLPAATPAPEPEPAPQPDPAPQPEPEPQQASEPEPVVPPVVDAPIVPVFTPIAPLTSAPVAPSPFPPLELTPAVEADFAEPVRDAWAPEQRGAPEEAETVLFEDEPPLAVLRHEVEPTPPRRFDWIETGPYMIMGGLGLFACAASAAAFRKAMTDRSPLDDYSVIAWVLALIGVICVGVSAWNLYVRATKRD